MHSRQIAERVSRKPEPGLMEEISPDAMTDDCFWGLHLISILYTWLSILV
jgi:hypothetical protein